MEKILPNPAKTLLEELIDTYARYSDEILMLITKTYEMIDQNKEERKEIKQKLRNRLAIESSMRNKDFDLITQKILEWQIIEEKKVKDGIQLFSIMQKSFEEKLKGILRSNDLQAFKILKYQSEQNIKTIIQLITTFHHEQVNFTQKLKVLLDDSLPLNIASLKTAMKQIMI